MTIQEIRVRFINLVTAIRQLDDSDQRFSDLKEECDTAVSDFDDLFPEAKSGLSTASAPQGWDRVEA